MKKTSLILAAVAALTTSMAAQASNFNGTITSVQADNADNGEVIGFKIVPASGVTLPACATGTYANAYIYVAYGPTGTGDTGRNITADAVLAAYTGAKNVRFISPGATCDASGRLYVQGVYLQ